MCVIVLLKKCRMWAKFYKTPNVVFLRKENKEMLLKQSFQQYWASPR